MHCWFIEPVFLQHPTADEDHVKNAVSSLVDEIVEVKKRHGDAYEFDRL